MDELRKNEADAREAEEGWALCAAEIEILFEGVPLFVNLGGEETIPAILSDRMVEWTLNGRSHRSIYHPSHIRPVYAAGEFWFEINDYVLNW